MMINVVQGSVVQVLVFFLPYVNHKVVPLGNMQGLILEPAVWLPVVERETPYLDGVVADDAAIEGGVYCAFWLVEVPVIGSSVGVGPEFSQGAVLVPEDSVVGILVLYSSCDGRVEVETLGSDRSSTGVCRGVLHAVRAVAESGCTAEVEVVEASPVDRKVLRARSDDSVRA